MRDIFWLEVDFDRMSHRVDDDYFREVFVDEMGEVWALDEVSDLFSRHHDLTVEQIERARRNKK